MFLEFYGLREQPFGVTPNPRFLYPSQSHQQALKSLIQGIDCDLGFAALVAEPGLGKTTLLFSLLERYRRSARTALLFTTQCSSQDFLRYLAADLGIASSHADPVVLHGQIRDVLVKEARSGRQVIVIVDEAHNLDDPVLETVRLLSDFETPETKLLHIVLAGQPQLAARLERPELSQLLQRIVKVNTLAPLTLEETSAYIDHRLTQAGYTGPGLFRPDAVEAIGHYSGGVPRNINRICFNALARGREIGLKEIQAGLIREVCGERNGAEQVAPEPSLPRPRMSASRESLPVAFTWANTAAASVLGSPRVEAWPDSAAGEPLPASLEPLSAAAPAAMAEIAEAPPPATPLAPPVPSTPALEGSVDKRPAQQPRAVPVVPICPEVVNSSPVTSAGPPQCATPRRRVAPPSRVVARPRRPRTYLRYGSAVVLLCVVAALLLHTSAATGSHVAARPGQQHLSDQPASKVQQPEAAKAAAPVASKPAATQDLRSNASSVPARMQNRVRTAMVHDVAEEKIRRPADVAEPALDEVLLASGNSGNQDSAWLRDWITRDLITNVTAEPRWTGGSSRVATGKLIRKVEPRYPEAARRARIEGVVVLNASISPEGRVQDLHIVSGNPLLAQAARDAVKDWRYEPWVLHGKPVRVETEIQVRFGLTPKPH